MLVFAFKVKHCRWIPTSQVADLQMCWGRPALIYYILLIPLAFCFLEWELEPAVDFVTLPLLLLIPSEAMLAVDCVLADLIELAGDGMLIELVAVVVTLDSDNTAAMVAVLDPLAAGIPTAILAAFGVTSQIMSSSDNFSCKRGNVL